MMKNIICLLIAFLLTSSVAFAIDAPNLKDTSMTIPWKDFKDILDQLQKKEKEKEPEPPVDYAIGRGTLNCVLDGGKIAVEAQYPLSVLKNGWVTIQLVPNNTPLAEITLDGKSAAVRDTGSNIELITKGPATRTLKMRFEINAPERPGPGSVAMKLPAAVGQVLSLKSGDKFRDIHIDGATMTPKGKGAYFAILQNDYLKVDYTVALEKKEQEAIEILPAKLLVENNTLVSIDEGFIRAVSQISYEVRHAPVSAFTLKVPPGYEVAECTGASLVGWKVDPETQILEASVGFEVKGSYDLTVVLEHSMQEDDFIFALPGLAAQDVERERGHFAVQVTGGVEVKPEKLLDLQPVDAKELPGALRGGATNPVVLSFKYLHQPFEGVIHVVRHKTQPVLGAAIDSANYVVQITEDGDCVVGATYIVRNNRKQFLEVTLPGGDNTKLWSSFVADKPVKPSQAKDGKVLLALEKSSQAGTQLESFKVEIIYYTSLMKKLRFAGVIHFILPQVDMPISRSMLAVYGPFENKYKRISGTFKEGYEESLPWIKRLPIIRIFDENARRKLEAIEERKIKLAQEVWYNEIGGDISGGYTNNFDDLMKYDKTITREAWDRLKKKGEMPGQESVADSVSYNKIQMSRGEGRGKSIDQKQVQAEMVFQQRLRAAQSARDEYGSLPTQFAIPKFGDYNRFHEYITIGESSTLNLLYYTRKLSDAVDLLALLLTALLAWAAKILLSGDKREKGGRKTFFAISAGIVLFGFCGASTLYIIFGAVIGLALRWVQNRYNKVAMKRELAATKQE